MNEREQIDAMWPDCHEVQCRQVHECLNSILDSLGIEYDPAAYVVGKAIVLHKAINALRPTALARTSKPVLEEAQEVITGPRRESYGDAKESFDRLAAMWSVLLRTPVKAAQVGQCMIALKLVRESNKHSRDNLVDLAGYTALLELL